MPSMFVSLLMIPCCNSLILDTEAFAPCLDLGCLPELSRIMGGIYHSLATIRAPEMVATIEAALK